MKYNGIDPRTLHPAISIAKEIPPGTVTSQLETTSGSTGEIIAGRTVKQGEYIVRVNIAGKSRAEGWRIRALLAGWARALDDQTHELIPTHWPQVAYDAILKEITPPEFSFGFCTVDVIFALPRAVAHDLAVTKLPRVSGEHVKRFLVDGSTYAKPEMTATLMESGDSFRIFVDDVCYVTMNGDFGVSDGLVMKNTPKFRLYDASESTFAPIDDRIDPLNTDVQAMWEALSPGWHTIRTEPASEIELTWRNEWL